MRTRVWASRLSRSVAVAAGLLLVAAVLPSPMDAAAVPVKYHGSRLRPYIALTIDDGYATANCKALADILKARNVPATYFPYSRVVTNHPTAWRHISAEGFRIADHTVSHPDLTDLSYSSQLWQIKTAKSRIQTVIGKSIAPLLRPPYGAWNYNTRVAAGAAGMKYLVMWDTSFADTATMSDTRHFNHAMRGTNGSIILCHCGPASTVRIMAKVIAAYRARGMKFVTVEQLLGLKPIGPTPTPTPKPTPTPTPKPTPTPTPTKPLPTAIELSPLPSTLVGSSTAVSTLEPQAATDLPEAIVAKRIELDRPPTLMT